MLTVSDVGKAYPTPRGPLDDVLSNVTFSLSPGEAAAITGPSGSGKSSLLYMLGALEPPSTGEITLGGQNPFTLSGARARGFPQRADRVRVSRSLFAPTVHGARERARADTGRPPQRARRRPARADVGCWTRLAFRHVSTIRPAELSGGEKQRVAIARALDPRGRGSSCATSPPATWTRRRPPRVAVAAPRPPSRRTAATSSSSSRTAIGWRRSFRFASSSPVGKCSGLRE